MDIGFLGPRMGSRRMSGRSLWNRLSTAAPMWESRGRLLQPPDPDGVDRIEQADAVLSGVVRAFESHALSANRRDEALQYEVALVVDMSLRRRVSNELLWRAQGTRLAEIYSGSRGAVVTSFSDFARGTLNSTDVRRLTDVQLTETSSQEARGRLIDRLARELHQRLVDLF